MMNPEMMKLAMEQMVSQPRYVFAALESTSSIQLTFTVLHTVKDDSRAGW